MIVRLMILAVGAALVIAAAGRIRGRLAAWRRRPAGVGGKPGAGRAQVEQAGKCRTCGAWVVAGARCSCGE